MCNTSCPQKVHNSFNDIKGVISSNVNFQSKTATIIFDDSQINSNQIASIISKNTYYKIKTLSVNEKPYSF